MELLKSGVNIIKNNYAELKMDFVFDSIIEGYVSKEIYVSSNEKPSASIVHEGNIFYFGGEPSSEEVYREAVEFFKKELLPDSKEKGHSMVKVLFTSSKWKDVIEDILDGYQHKCFERTLFVHKFQNIPEGKALDEELSILEVDKLLLDKRLKNAEQMIDEIEKMWGSVDAFLKDGFGFCVIKNNEILCWCTGEYKSKAACGIGIETAREYQGQGIATLAATSFVKKCKTLGIIPYWDSWKENIPSVRTAERVGFEKILDYEAMLIRL